jgi:Gas vesicle synthesis protein GvpL/GvpF
VAPTASTEGGNGWYVYGVVPAEGASEEMFADARGVDPAGKVMLVADGDLAAIASGVPLADFGETAIEKNLLDETWLEEKVRAHESVLEAALTEAPLVPFRFGTIFRSDDQVRRMLRENAHLTAVLERLRGTLELGVKAFLDADEFERRHGDEVEAGEGGRAYLLRKQRDRRLTDARVSFVNACAKESHEQLASASEDARANPLQRPEVSGRAGEMVLNGVYLVRRDDEAAFKDALSALESRFAPDGVRYELTGPWPPYNFVEVGQ